MRLKSNLFSLAPGFSQVDTTGSSDPKPFETVEPRLSTALKCGANEINGIEAPQTKNG
jgi:hypothetical protein